MADIEDAPTAEDGVQLPDSMWTVAELNAEIGAVLAEHADRFPTYVLGEVADVDQYDFGTFFDLADPNGDAVIACLAWSRVVDASEHELTAGTTTLVEAEVDFYAERGDCQLLVAGYWPIGEGARAQAVAQLRSTLEDDGLLDDDRKQALPPYPTCIGVVTSLAGSARDDITTTIHDRHPGIRIKLCGATVQGEDAVPSLVGAVQTLETDPTVDVLVITRGGGADTDLWCFNEEPVVRAIAETTTPVLVAIGHEDDQVLAEAVADARAMTPTAAAVATTPELAAIRATVAQLEARITDAYATLVDEQLGAYERTIDTALTALRHAAATRRAERRQAYQRAADLERRIHQAYVTLVDRDLDRLDARVESAYRDLEADARIQAGTAEARRLRIAVAVLLVILLLGGLAVAVGLL